jgi:alpha-beta hydrolase superfamily lysophospholipase
MARERFDFFSDADGVALKGYHWASNDAVGAVLISHGLGEHCLRYEPFAAFLNGARFDVFAFDQRGHGPAAEATNTLGDFGVASWTGLVADLAQACNHIRTKCPNVPLFLFAHSMGSLAAQVFLPDNSNLIDGVILSGSADAGAIAQLTLDAAETDDSAGSSFSAFNTAFEPARTAFDWLSRDDAQVDAYVADPLCGFEATNESSATMMSSGLALNDPATFARIRNDLPVYIFSGDQDPIHGGGFLFDSLVEKFKSAGFRGLESKLYPGGRHEMLNETNRAEVMADILAWLANRL